MKPQLVVRDKKGVNVLTTAILNADITITHDDYTQFIVTVSLEDLKELQKQLAELYRNMNRTFGIK